MVVHTSDCKRCGYCKGREKMQQRRKVARLKNRKAFLKAKHDAIMDRKVIVLTVRDDFTGYFYRYDDHGQMITLGCGVNIGA